METRLQDREIRRYLDQLTGANPSAIGQLILSAPTANLPDLSQSPWVTITQFDATVPAANAVGMTLDPVAGTIAPQILGLWRIDFNFSMDHNQLASGRSLDFIRYNPSANSFGRLLRIGVGNDQPNTTFSLSYLADIGQADLNEPLAFRIKMGPGSADMTSIVFWELNFAATYVGNFDNLTNP